MKITKSITVGIIILLNQTISARDYFVQTPSGIVMRAAPAKTGKKVILIPFNSKIAAANDATTGEPLTMDGITAGWLQVSYKGKTGYVYRGLVAPYPAITEGQVRVDTNFIKGLKLKSKKVDEFKCNQKKEPDCDIKREYSNVTKEYTSRDGKVLVQVIETGGYESGGVSVVVTGLTLEDIFLMARNWKPVFRSAQYGTALSKQDVDAKYSTEIRYSVDFSETGITFQYTAGAAEFLRIEKQEGGKLKITIEIMG